MAKEILSQDRCKTSEVHSNKLYLSVVIILFEYFYFSFSYCLHACLCTVNFVVALEANKQFSYLLIIVFNINIVVILIFLMALLTLLKSLISSAQNLQSQYLNPPSMFII